MKKLWSAIKEKWRHFWQDDSYDKSVYHLSQSDKRDLLYGAFMLCMGTAAFCSLVIGFNNIRVTANSEELLDAVSALISQYGKIGGNLNQIARHLNGGGTFYGELAKEISGAAADLAALKFEVLKVIGEAYGNDKTYQL